MILEISVEDEDLMDTQELKSKELKVDLITSDLIDSLLD